jgi:putative acetyltransferase
MVCTSGGKADCRMLFVPNIAPAGQSDLSDVRQLFREYSGLVQAALCFQNFDAELAALPGAYAPPSGALLIAREGATAAGCVALRTLEDRTAEMKRMFVRESHRGSGLGRRLALAIIDEARSRQCRRMVLDTMPHLAAAIALYKDLGFKESEPYLAAPTPGALCFELKLS